MKQARTLWLSGAFALALALPAAADGEAAPAADAAVGPVTSLPLPRYVSLKTGEGNVRRGPSLEHRIDWVFHHRDYPLRITGEFEHWRRVEDMEGQGGWIYYTMLSGVRTVLVTEARTELRRAPEEKSDILALADEGVIGRLGACTLDWCEISAGGEEGWVEKSRLWGVDPEEIRD
jgi:SH3-like domain-containing protein